MKNNRLNKIFFLVFLVIPVLLAGQKSASLEGDLEMLRKLHSTRAEEKKGLDLLLAKDWEGAAGHFNKCLEILPIHPNACFGMATMANQMGDVVQSLSWIERAEKGCLSLQQVWNNQKTNLFKVSREDEKRLRELATQDIGANTNSISCVSRDSAFASKKTGRATEHVLADDKTADSPFAIPAEFFVLHGNLLFKQKRFAEAEAKYLAALTVEPAHERCLNNLVNIYFVSGRLALALEWLEKAGKQKVKINPKLEKAVREAAEKK